LLAGCAGGKVNEGRKLLLSLQPPEIKAGQLIQLSVKPESGEELAWVSGTVKVMGAPVLPLKKGQDGNWVFRTMVPAFAVISPGTYEARAWGDAPDGRRFEGSLSVVVK
jgi:hypothetical protein